MRSGFAKATEEVEKDPGRTPSGSSGGPDQAMYPCETFFMTSRYFALANDK